MTSGIASRRVVSEAHDGPNAVFGVFLLHRRDIRRNGLFLCWGGQIRTEIILEIPMAHSHRLNMNVASERIARVLFAALSLAVWVGFILLLIWGSPV